MAITFIEAGTDETQDFSLFGGSSNATSDTTQSVDGGRSIKCASTGTGAGPFTNDGVVADAGSCLSAWFYFSTATPATVALFISVETSGNGSMVMGVGLNTNGTLRFGGRGTTQTNGTTVLSANTWYRMSMSYVVTSTSSWSFKFYINGQIEFNLTQTLGNLGLTGSTCATFGVGNSSQNGFNNPPTMNVWVDSIYADNRTDFTDCGNIHVTAKRPFSNGTVTGFTTQIGSGGSGYGSGHTPQVNERPLSITNGWSMVGAGSAVTEEYTVEGKSVGDVDITTATLIDYMGWVDVKALLAETATIIVGGVNSNISVTTSAAIFTKVAGSATYPAGGTDIGVITATTVTTFSLYECGLIFAYIPVSTYVPRLALLGVG